MENFLKLYLSPGKTRLVLLLLAGTLFFSSCGGEEGAIREETLYFNEANKSWISNDSIGDHFYMVDNNGITQSFAMNTDSYYFNKSWSSFLGINTHMTHTEYHHQSYISGFGINFSISLTAGSPPFGDELYLELDGVGFSYDFDFEIVTRLSTPFGYKSMLMTDKGYEAPDNISSRVELIGNLAVKQETFEEVLKFTFNDFNDLWTDFTVKEIYVARDGGLIKWVLQNGITCERI